MSLWQPLSQVSKKILVYPLGFNVFLLMGNPNKAEELDTALRKGDKSVFQEETFKVRNMIKCPNLSPDLLSPAG